jgi:hypothetical protein
MLEVHHRTYERLGDERDEDLEVLCTRCHEQHHIAALEEAGLGIYLKLARLALRRHPLGSIADLSERIKLACARAHIPYDGPTIHRALHLITGHRLVHPPKAGNLGMADTYMEKPLLASESHEILARLGVLDAVRMMPIVESPEEHEAKVRAQAEVFRRLYRPRRNLRDVLDAIFSGTWVGR